MAEYAFFLGLTILVELPLFVALAPRGSRRRAGVDCVWINLATHPCLSIGLRAGVPFVVGESLVVVAEAVALRAVTRVAWRRAWWISGVANAVTAGLSFAF